MKKILFFVLLITLSFGQVQIKRSQRSKHGEDCISDSACEEGLVCKINRCFTKFESSHLKELGLLEKNICDLKKKCPANKKCVKHRCVDENTPIEPPKNKTADVDDVHLVFAGGIDLNRKPYLSGLKPDHTVNYDHLFTHINSYIKGADLAVVAQESPFYIQEGTLIKDSKKTPKELADAIANAGFKLVLHASTNAYLHKEKGIIDTLNYWKTKHPEVRPLGIASTEEESQKDYFIFEKNNIKIGIINYSGFVGKSIPSKNKFMVNIISRKKVEECIPQLKKEVDFIIICINWGEKYGLNPNKNEMKWAKELTRLGADLIIGNNPSFVQPTTFVKAENGNCALVFFSLGNLIGENLKKTSALGALANIVISKENGKTFISSYNLIPTINHAVSSPQYSVYKLSEYTDLLGKEVNKKFSLENAKGACRSVMGAFAHCG